MFKQNKIFVLATIAILSSTANANQNSANFANTKGGMIRPTEIQKINEQLVNKKQTISAIQGAQGSPAMQPTTPAPPTEEPTKPPTEAIPAPNLAPVQNVQPNTTFVPPQSIEPKIDNEQRSQYFQNQNIKKEQFFAQKLASLNVRSENQNFNQKQYATSYSQQKQKPNKNLNQYIERARRAGISEGKINLELTRKNEENFIAWVERATSQ